MRDDVKAAIRALRQTPTFTAVALAVLALGIGAATALYSVVDAVVLRGLPFDQHDRLMAVLEYDTTRETTFGNGNITPQAYLDWRAQQQSFDGIAATTGTSFRLRNESGEPADARALRVTHEFFRTWLPTNLPRVADVALNLRVFGGALAAAVATGVIFGIVPALHASRADVVSVLKEDGRSTTATSTSNRLRNVLVVAEVAIAVVLLVGAGLFAGSFVRLIRIDPGFDYHNLLTYNVSVRFNFAASTPAQRAEAGRRGRDYATEMFDAVSRIPGITAVTGVSEGLPLSGSWSRSRIAKPGEPRMESDDDSIDRNTVRPNFFETLRISLKRGRVLNDGDRDGAPLVMVINEAAASKYFPGRKPWGSGWS